MVPASDRSPNAEPSRGVVIVVLYVVPLIIAVLLGSLAGYLVSQADCDVNCLATNAAVSVSQHPGGLDPLSGEEMKKIESELISRNLIDGRDTTLTFSSSYITSMSIFPPDKQEALLHSEDKTYILGRVAEVHVVGKTNIQILHVGPLHEDPLKLNIVDTLPLEARHIDEFVIAELEKLVAPVLAELKVVLAESFDGASYPEHLGINFNTGYNLHTANGRETRFSLHFRGLGELDTDLFNMLPLSGIVIFKGNTLSGWRLKELFYANQGPYVSAAALVADYKQGTLRKITLPKGYRNSLYDRLFPKSSGERKGSNLAPPLTYAPAGARYTIDRYNVNWLGWTFYISNNPMRGLSVYNARFKDMSVLYELSLQDILVSHVSDTHGESNMVYLLSAFNIGAFEGVILGVDCPKRASLLSTMYWNKYSRTVQTSKSICVFEADAELPLWRRKGREFASGLRDTYLVVRATAKIFSLDYTMEYRFHLDGSIDTNIHSFGALQGAFWDANKRNLISVDDQRNAFGYRLEDYVGGISGSHSFNFKVDMDVRNQNNRFDEISWKSGNVMTALRSYNYVKELPDYFVTNVTWYPKLKHIDLESGLFKDILQQVWLVSAEKDGPGYQVVVDTSATDFLPISHPAAEVASFTKYDLAVLNRKSTEPYFTNAYDANDFSNSGTNIDTFLNPRESIINSDIVLSVNVGFMDLPHSEDVPVQRRQTATFRLLPFNAFPGSPDLDVPSYLQTDDNSASENPPQPPRCVERIP